MKYVQKTDAPQFFIDNTNGKTLWVEYPVSKIPLKDHILKEEQNYLCIYCESKIAELNNSHLEHIKPKAQSMYPDLVFEYNNIVVSCNGNCHTGDDNKHTCGHLKDNEYDESKFLNPVEVEDIRDYFIYDIDEGKIESSRKDKEKAQYMIDTLHLNDGALPIARKKALANFIKYIKQYDKSQRKNKIIEFLNRENITFVSFLRFKYINFL